MFLKGREVRGGLERLFKKVEKHLSEEENLLQVVWHHMQVSKFDGEHGEHFPELPVSGGVYSPVQIH